MIVVTGAAGFIGSNVVAALNDAGRDDLVLCDRLGQDDRWQNLRKRMFRNFVFPDQLFEFLVKAQDVEGIVHMGAISSTTTRDGDAVMRDNFQFSLGLLDLCAARGIPLVYASSAATYGDGSQGFVDDLPFSGLRKLRPLNLYGWSKHQFDLVVAERRELGLPLPPRCVGLKFFNVFGPNEYHKGDMMSVVARNHGIAAAGGEVELFMSHRSDFADGEQRRDFVLVDDVADVVIWALTHGPACGLLNVGTGQATSFRDLIGALFAALGREPRTAYVPMPEGLRDRYQYATEAPLGALRNAGYRKAFTPVPEAVARYAGFLGAADRYR